MKEAAEKETRRRDVSEKNMLDGLNMEQLTSSIARYESRLQDMGELLQQKS